MILFTTLPTKIIRRYQIYSYLFSIIIKFFQIFWSEWNPRFKSDSKEVVKPNKHLFTFIKFISFQSHLLRLSVHIFMQDCIYILLTFCMLSINDLARLCPLFNLFTNRYVQTFQIYLSSDVENFFVSWVYSSSITLFSILIT